jgi:hypothetical protein
MLRPTDRFRYAALTSSSLCYWNEKPTCAWPHIFVHHDHVIPRSRQRSVSHHFTVVTWLCLFVYTAYSSIIEGFLETTASFSSIVTDECYHTIVSRSVTAKPLLHNIITRRTEVKG